LLGQRTPNSLSLYQAFVILVIAVKDSVFYKGNKNEIYL
jgi:hypothetical protein